MKSTDSPHERCRSSRPDGLVVITLYGGSPVVLTLVDGASRARTGDLPGAIQVLVCCSARCSKLSIRILNETQPRAALANAVRLALGFNPLRLQLGKCAIEVVDSDSDVAITGA